MEGAGMRPALRSHARRHGLPLVASAARPGSRLAGFLSRCANANWCIDAHWFNPCLPCPSPPTDDQQPAPQARRAPAGHRGQGAGLGAGERDWGARGSLHSRPARLDTLPAGLHASTCSTLPSPNPASFRCATSHLPPVPLPPAFRARWPSWMMRATCCCRGRWGRCASGDPTSPPATRTTPRPTRRRLRVGGAPGRAFQGV